MNRRSFWKSLVKGAAIVALAPQLAFRVPKLEFPHIVIGPPVSVLNLDELFKACYEIKRRRDADHRNREFIDFYVDREDFDRLKANGLIQVNET